MNRFISRPNLPQSRVSNIVIGELYKNILSQKLNELGISVIWMPEMEELPHPVRGHADLSLLHLGNDRFIAARELPGTFISALEELGAAVELCTVSQGSRYPADCRLNAAIIGEHIIINPGTAAFEPFASMIPITVKQGYARCSVCIVDERSIITSDNGIYRAASEAGLDVLLISSGHINLKGYGTGFIGGCAFKTAPDEIAFTGDLFYHPDGKKILSFLSEKGVEPRFLTNTPLFDIGGAVILCEDF